MPRLAPLIIPLREKIGNYDSCNSLEMVFTIIPLREKIGNYDYILRLYKGFFIIPLREKIGNYDRRRSVSVQGQIMPLK